MLTMSGITHFDVDVISKGDKFYIAHPSSVNNLNNAVLELEEFLEVLGGLVNYVERQDVLATLEPKFIGDELFKSFLGKVSQSKLAHNIAIIVRYPSDMEKVSQHDPNQPIAIALRSRGVQPDELWDLEGKTIRKLKSKAPLILMPDIQLLSDQRTLKYLQSLFVPIVAWIVDSEELLQFAIGTKGITGIISNNPIIILQKVQSLYNQRCNLVR